MAIPRLFRLARVLTGNDHDAWDLTQESMIKIGVRWAHIDQRQNVDGYARTTLIRLNLNRMRNMRRERLTSTFAQRPSPPNDTVAVEAFEPWLEKALASLPARQRACVVLRHLDDVSVADIATVLRCSTGTVKTHLSRGLATLNAAAPAGSPTRDTQETP